MSEAYWLFMFSGDINELKRDVEKFPTPTGVELITYESSERFAIHARDTSLGGRDTMPYPNQIAFLDYITETEGFKAGRYLFSSGAIIYPEGYTGPKHWTVEDYLEGKRHL